MAGKGFTDKGNRITPTSPFDWDTGAKLSAGEGAGTSDTTEATQLLVKTATETSATNSTALIKTEDTAHASGDKGVMALVVRKDTAAALAGTDGDYAPLEVDASGRLWVNVGAMAALPAGSNNIGDVDVASSALPTGASTSANQTSALTKLDTLHTDLTTPATELPKTPLMGTSDLTASNVSRSGVGETSMVAATTSQTTKLYGYAVTVPGAGTVEVRDGVGGTALRKHIFPAAGGIIRDVRSRPYAKTTANTALVFYWSGTGEANIDFDYVTGA